MHRAALTTLPNTHYDDLHAHHACACRPAALHAARWPASLPPQLLLLPPASRFPFSPTRMPSASPPTAACLQPLRLQLLTFCLSPPCSLSPLPSHSLSCLSASHLLLRLLLLASPPLPRSSLLVPTSPRSSLPASRPPPRPTLSSSHSNPRICRCGSARTPAQHVLVPRRLSKFPNGDGLRALNLCVHGGCPISAHVCTHASLPPSASAVIFSKCYLCATFRAMHTALAY